MNNLCKYSASMSSILYFGLTPSTFLACKTLICEHYLILIKVFLNFNLNFLSDAKSLLYLTVSFDWLVCQKFDIFDNTAVAKSSMDCVYDLFLM